MARLTEPQFWTKLKAEVKTLTDDLNKKIEAHHKWSRENLGDPQVQVYAKGKGPGGAKDNGKRDLWTIWKYSLLHSEEASERQLPAIKTQLDAQDKKVASLQGELTKLKNEINPKLDQILAKLNQS